MDETCVECGGPLGDSPSDDFCSPEHQERWHSKTAIHAIVRPASRAASYRIPYVPAATWPRPPIPHPAGGITYPASESDYRQWIEDTDPDPAPGGGDRLPNSTYRKATT